MTQFGGARLQANVRWEGVAIGSRIQGGLSHIVNLGLFGATLREFVLK